MSKPFTNPFFEADMSKFFDMSKFDMSKMMDMSKWQDFSKTMDFSKFMDGYKSFDFSKMACNCQLPQFDIEALMALQRKNMEACAALSQAAYENMQALWNRQASSCRQAIEEMTQVVQAIVACPTPEAKAMKQAEASKAAMEKYIANLRDTSETLAKCNTQAMEALNTRMSDSLNEMRGIVKPSAARVA